MLGYTIAHTGITRKHNTLKAHWPHRGERGKVRLFPKDDIGVRLLHAVVANKAIGVAIRSIFLRCDSCVKPTTGAFAEQVESRYLLSAFSQTQDGSVEPLPSDACDAAILLERAPQETSFVTASEAEQPVTMSCGLSEDPMLATADTEPIGVPDLVVEVAGWTPAEYVGQGDPFSIYCNVTNVGSDWSGESYAHLWFSAQRDSDVADAYDMGELYVPPLAPNCWVTLYWDWVIPTFDPASTYSLFPICQADSRGQVAESNEDNFQRSETAINVTQPLPDLVVESPILHSVISEDTPCSLRCAVRNTGLGSAGQHYVRMWLSTDDQLDISQDYDLGEQLVSALGVGSVFDLRWDFIMPKLSSGCSKVWAFCQPDSRNQVMERNENNLYTDAIGFSTALPDLRIRELSGISSTNVGDRCSVLCLVFNEGTASSPESLTRLWLSTDGDLDTSDDYDLGEQVFPAIDPGGSATRTWEFPMPKLGSQMYRIWLIAKTDDRSQIVECNDENNVYKPDVLLTVSDPSELPDLQFRDVTVLSATAHEGDSFWVEAQIYNDGPALAAESAAAMLISIDGDLDLSDDYWLGVRPVAALAPGASDYPRWQFSMPDLGTGTYKVSLICRLNFRDQISEPAGPREDRIDDVFTAMDPQPTGTITGAKWNDLNGNGVWDPAEAGLPGWTIYLDQNLNGRLDTSEPSTTTALNGSYAFTDLSPGTYQVAELSQPGWIASCSACSSPAIAVEVQSGEISGLPPTGQQARADYVIITTSTIARNSKAIPDFVAHKQSRGYAVQVVTEESWGGGTGDVAAERLRAWLRDNYRAMGIQYVLLVGDPNPSTGDVPMKMTWPRNNAETYPEYKDAPTDYYYADLTTDWDVDGDGMFGEMVDDINERPIHEVLVGRIPVYGQNWADLDSILYKTIKYENQVDIAWRRSMLLPMGIVNYENEGGESIPQIDGHELADTIRSNLAIPRDYTTYRMYEQAGFSPVTAQCEAALTNENLVKEWSTHPYGIVAWQAHGNTGLIARKYTDSDPTGPLFFLQQPILFSTADCAALNDEYPSVVIQASCKNGYPEASDNLGYSLLKRGAIVAFSASRVTWGEGDWSPSTGWETGGDSSYAYYITQCMTGHDQTATAAGALQYCRESFGSSGILMDSLAFNLYGDPSISLSAGGAVPPFQTVTVAAGQTITGVTFGSRYSAAIPEIECLAVNPKPMPGERTLSLTVQVVPPVDGRIAQVIFYRESNDIPGLQTGCEGDALLGSDDGNSYSVEVSTIGLPAGTYTYYAQAQDDAGTLSNVTSTTYTVYQPHIEILGNNRRISPGDLSSGVEDATDFGSARLVDGTITHVFVIRNTGTGPLNLLGEPRVTVEGLNPQDFFVVQEPPSQVLPGAAAAFSVIFSPSELGTRRARICIASDDPDFATFSFDITGEAIPAVPLQVFMIPTTTGCRLAFSRAIDGSVLNLYDGQDPSVDLPDLMVVGEKTGPVAGSLVWDKAHKIAEFVKTGDILTPDTYTVTLASRADGWRDTYGELLDGDADGLAGGDYHGTFHIDPSDAPIVTVPDIARGPGQAITLPVRIDNAAGVQSVALQLLYSSSLLEFGHVTLASDMPADWTVTAKRVADQLLVSLSGTSALNGHAKDLFCVVGRVQDTARYKAIDLLQLQDVKVNGITSRGDTSVQVIADLGDASGNMAFDSTDIGSIAGVSIGRFSGFDAFSLVDPRIIGDVSGNGSIGGLDASFVAQKVAAMSRSMTANLAVTLPAASVSVSTLAVPDPQPAVSTFPDQPATAQPKSQPLPTLASSVFARTVIEPIRRSNAGNGSQKTPGVSLFGHEPIGADILQ
ncbi:MAG TPA: C25 family cysteine peptidase [Tepidisphaeraceae bacterium]|nr:C25 family cysteine peptidase [Tepidisphaeraceae bacterium]